MMVYHNLYGIYIYHFYTNDTYDTYDTYDIHTYKHIYIPYTIIVYTIQEQRSAEQQVTLYFIYISNILTYFKI